MAGLGDGTMSGVRPWLWFGVALLVGGALVGLELALGRPGNGPRFEGQVGFYAAGSAGLCLLLGGVSLLVRLVLGRSDPTAPQPGERGP